MTFTLVLIAGFWIQPANISYMRQANDHCIIYSGSTHGIRIDNAKCEDIIEQIEQQISATANRSE